MNKYAEQAKAAQDRRRAQRMCFRKVRFATQQEAYQKGQDTYMCPICLGWHRTGAIGKLVARVRKKVVKK